MSFDLFYYSYFPRLGKDEQVKTKLGEKKSKREALEKKISFRQGKEKMFLNGLGKPPVLVRLSTSFLLQLVEL